VPITQARALIRTLSAYGARQIWSSTSAARHGQATGEPNAGMSHTGTPPVPVTGVIVTSLAASPSGPLGRMFVLLV
jgi:hypothetical protein